MLPEPVAGVVERFVARLDQAVPEAVAGFYVAGSVALGGFRADAGWHPVIRDALAYWRGLPPLPGRTSRVLRAETAAFVSRVIDVAGSAAAAD